MSEDIEIPWWRFLIGVLFGLTGAALMVGTMLSIPPEPSPLTFAIYTLAAYGVLILGLVFCGITWTPGCAKVVLAEIHGRGSDG